MAIASWQEGWGMYAALVLIEYMQAVPEHCCR